MDDSPLTHLAQICSSIGIEPPPPGQSNGAQQPGSPVNGQSLGKHHQQALAHNNHHNQNHNSNPASQRASRAALAKQHTSRNSSVASTPTPSVPAESPRNSSTPGTPTTPNQAAGQSQQLGLDGARLSPAGKQTAQSTAAAAQAPGYANPRNYLHYQNYYAQQQQQAQQQLQSVFGAGGLLPAQQQYNQLMAEAQQQQFTNLLLAYQQHQRHIQAAVGHPPYCLCSACIYMKSMVFR